jgi:hypothetical protein
VGDLQFVAAGYELTAIPEAAGGFHGHDENGAGNQSNDPAHDIVHSVEIHGVYLFWFPGDVGVSRRAANI